MGYPELWGPMEKAGNQYLVGFTYPRGSLRKSLDRAKNFAYATHFPITAGLCVKALSVILRPCHIILFPRSFQVILSIILSSISINSRIPTNFATFENNQIEKNICNVILSKPH